MLVVTKASLLSLRDFSAVIDLSGEVAGVLDEEFPQG